MEAGEWDPSKSEAKGGDGLGLKMPLREVTNVKTGSRPSSKSEDAPKLSGPTIRQIRQSMRQSLPPQPPPFQPPASQVPSPAPRKKSFFGSLLSVKEPTQTALNQVAAQMIAQHGSTSPRKVPNVRMERMPEHVPKVNSKWDGVPDLVKVREKQEKERERARKRQSLAPGQYHRSQSADSDEPSAFNRRSYISSSSGSKPKSINSSNSDHRVSRNPNPHRFYAVSCNSSGDLAAQQRDDDNDTYDHQNASDQRRPRPSTSRSVPSSSGASLPDVTAFLPGDVPANPSIPEQYRAEAIPVLGPPSASDRPSTHDPALPIIHAPPVEAIPEHTSSPIATPRDRSPITPLTQQIQDLSINEISATTASKLEDISVPQNISNQNLPPQSQPKKTSRPVHAAFLAGEAQELQLSDDEEDGDDQQPIRDLPLRDWNNRSTRSSGLRPPNKQIDKWVPDVEKRPDSSRARLGLRPGMLVRDEAAPWEGSDSQHTPPPLSPASTRTSMGPLTPRTFLSKSLYGSLRSTRS